MENFDQLKLKNQMCFPLYAASKELIRSYTPFLEPLGITYTQYLVLLVLREEKEIGVKELGSRLYLDSGTLSPLLKKLIEKEYIKKARKDGDERNVIISLTQKGLDIKEEAKEIPFKVGKCINLTIEESGMLYNLLYKMLGGFKNE